MKVRCKFSSYRDIVPALDPKDYPPTSVLDLIVGQEYVVYGIISLKRNGKLLFLIIDDTYSFRYPSFMPSDLFEISDPKLPDADWAFLKYGEEYEVEWIFCYDKFIDNLAYLNEILLRDRDLSLFDEWRMQVDRQYKEKYLEDRWEAVNANIDGVDISFMRNKKTGELKDFRFI